MSTVVRKHALPDVINALDLPAGVTPLHFGEQNGGLYLWEAHGTEGNRTENRTFEVVGTGHPANVSPKEYIGTAQTRGGFVFHLFETTYTSPGSGGVGA